MKKQSGFTLIELIMVIVILGILSAVALPRFASLGDEAEEAKAEGALAAVKSASAISHAQYLAGGDFDTTDTPDETVELEGVEIDIIFGYPAVAETTGSSGHGTIFDAAGLDSNDFTASVTGTTMTITTSESNCSFTYAEPASDGNSPTISTIGC